MTVATHRRNSNRLENQKIGAMAAAEKNGIGSGVMVFSVAAVTSPRTKGPASINVRTTLRKLGGELIARPNVRGHRADEMTIATGYAAPEAPGGPRG
jgi:hypothetical protein